MCALGDWWLKDAAPRDGDRDHDTVYLRAISEAADGSWSGKGLASRVCINRNDLDDLVFDIRQAYIGCSVSTIGRGDDLESCQVSSVGTNKTADAGIVCDAVLAIQVYAIFI